MYWRFTKAALMLAVLLALLPAKAVRAAPNSTYVNIQGNFLDTCYGQAAPSACYERDLQVEIMVDGARSYYLTSTDIFGFAQISIPYDVGTVYWWAQAESTLADGGSREIYNPGSVLILPVFLAADANTDNIVNSADFAILKGTFGKGCGDPGYDQRGDFNRNCVSDGADFAKLKTNFGFIGYPQW